MSKVLRGIKRAYGTVRRKIVPGGVILAYHRISNSAIDTYDLSVSPDHFAQHLKYIRQKCHPLTLAEMAEASQEGHLPNRAVAITLDDGYGDNYSRARPLLESENIPATIFIATGYVNGSKEFWWDDLERILLEPERVPDHLRISIENQDFEFPLSSKKDRIYAHQTIYESIRPLPPGKRQTILRELSRWAKINDEVRTELRPMNAGELRNLASNNAIDLGAHTINHPVLSTLPLEVQRDEILNSRVQLEGIIGRPVTSFAYPYGKAPDFTDETAEIIETAGFRLACTTIPGCVEAGDNIFRLRRFVVKNWDPEVFSQRFERVLLS